MGWRDDPSLGAIRVAQTRYLSEMLARILEPDGSVTVSTEGPAILAAIKSKKTVWCELERKTDEADALLTGLEIHALTIEDIWGPSLQPKLDDFPHYLYIIVHGIGSAKKTKLALLEVDLLIGPNWVVSHDRHGLVADDIGTELDHSPRLLARGPAWLAHGILDRVVDRYLPIIDQLDSEIDQLENDVIEKAGTAHGKAVLTRILEFKRLLQGLRRMSIHQREILLRLARGEFDEIPPEALPFFRDVYDHFLRIQDIAEGYRDLVTSCLDAYLSVQSNRMNEVMKTLTLMSTVMLPLTFIAGVYGMNFDHMPELHTSWGYVFALALMAGVGAGILLWFRHKGWIGHGEASGAKPRRKPPSKRAE
ncbi:MAG: Magnesium and cobalt transport protein CorA [Deltaproteobacteria bacterium]|nr:Magnesium and cobalt transport protein CorA [Deltaproteobacteria bacterium]